MIPRTILPKLLSEAEKPFVSILIGPRQVGKTTLLRMIGQNARRKTTYLDLEDPLDALVLRDGLTSLIAEIGSEPQILFLDEFYRFPDALALFRQLRDRFPAIKVYASGSSSIEVHSHLKQSAVGRVRRTRIFPLSFPEWAHDRADVDLHTWDPWRPLPPRARAAASGLLEEFIVWGGMPELTTTTAELERREILHEIVSLYLEKDIKSLLREEELLGYNQFIRLLCNRIGQLMNRAEYSRILGISTRQVAKQLQVMEHTFVLRSVSTDYSNPTKRLVRAPRIYWYDNGLRNALVRDFRPRRDRPDAGALLENHIFTELEKAADIGTQILFHRTHDQQEIDFILERDRQKILVEVKSAWTRPRVPRAVQGMLDREDVLGAVVLNDDTHEVRESAGKPVLLLPHVLAHRVPAMWDQLKAGGVEAGS